MRILTEKINLDLNQNGIQATIDLREGDIESRLIIATLRGYGDAFRPDDNVIAVIRAKKPDGTIIYNNCLVEDGKVKFLVSSQYAAVEGNYNACIELIKDGVVLYSPKFSFHVAANELSDSEVESSSEYTELTTALEQALTALELAQNLHLLKFVENLEDEGDEKYLYVLTSDYHYIPYVWDAENERYMELESNLEELAEFSYLLSIQKERVDNLLAEAVPGSTTRDLEVIDGRTGYDGRTYANLGTAIREQINDLHSENTNLQNSMEAADTNLNNIKANKSDVNTTTANLENEIAVERARIDNIASLTEGSTTGDAELLDIRVESNGATASTAGDSVRNQITNLRANIGNYDISDCFELGDIYMTASGWSYSNSNTRVRTKNGLTLKINKNEKLGLSDYTDARYYVGWLNKNGVYNNRGWLKQDFVTTEDGDYVILITSDPEKTETSADDLASLFFGYVGIVFDYITKNTNDIKYLNELLFLNYETYPGYVRSDGTFAPASATEIEVYSEYIPVWDGVVFNFDFKYLTADHACWCAYALYDENKRFISRTVVRSEGLRKFNVDISISDPNAKFIVLTYRTFDDCETMLKTINIINVVNKNSKSLFDSLRQSFNEIISQSYSEINKNIFAINHRGYNTIAPENTLPAYTLSKEKGFSYVETDVSFTSDGIPVLLHDDTINRTARNADGTTISETIYISNITYEQALEYDFGIWKSNEYAGTKIPTLKEFVILCRNLGLNPYIELKDGTEQRIQNLVDIVKECGMDEKVTWISFSDTLLSYIKNYDSKARLGLVVGTLDTTKLNNALALKTNDNKVFIDHYVYDVTDEIVNLCIENNLALEVWTVDSKNTILSANPYITGFTSDSMIAGYELYNASK